MLTSCCRRSECIQYIDIKEVAACYWPKYERESGIASV
jgi:hypothetical protein